MTTTTSDYLTSYADIQYMRDSDKVSNLLRSIISLINIIVYSQKSPPLGFGSIFFNKFPYFCLLIENFLQNCFYHQPINYQSIKYSSKVNSTQQKINPVSIIILFFFQKHRHVIFPWIINVNHLQRLASNQNIPNQIDIKVY